jgi:hypothetical protein
MIVVGLLIMMCKISKNSSISQGNASDDVSVESYIKFLESDPSYKFKDELKYLTAIDITKSYDDTGKNFYLAKVSSQFMWESQLFMLTVDNGKIVKVTDTGLGGNDAFFSYEVVTISEGTFIVAYCSSHMGNGRLEFVSILQPGIVKYTIHYAVDNEYEDNEKTATEYGLLIPNSNITASSVYVGGKLDVGYMDIDQDGNTDVVLKGIQQIYEKGLDGIQILRKEYFLENIYLFSSIGNDFVFDEELSRKIPVP